ncbi:hypothetical protein [Aestuariispira insulae]|uniref:YggT family protein n=1 Tax=Aestuariispira insulae TaxID=1461337 RepID=A0A3D9H1I3_9PROT|nr:hypothetical protein [Aestuariispira insulae]RED43360.1 hypothetical protein DFP90_1233 [Aestuariispira insulae]
MNEAIADFPIWVIVADYLMGIIMWTLIGRVAMNFFLPVDSPFFFMKAFVKGTDPVLRIFKPITPGFLIEPMIPLYVAWFFFMIRFYLMPWLLGYSVMGMLSFPLESDITHALFDAFYTKTN